ncbi:hypothetical protein I317_06374 [Kwoniella heveanensis CBS 569]|nr:hypothetical protein I317_06374 [Kwoniella heveanensis CBS 569]
MDRGAARSRKRAAQGSKPNPAQSAVPGPGPSTPSTSTSHWGESSGRASHAERESAPQRGRGKRPFGTREGHQGRPSKKTDRSAPGVTDEPKNEIPRGPRHNPNNDPNQYKPKAIRTSAALIYSQSAFSIPPSSETLKTVRRVDLSGSGCTNVSWLLGTEVTWLSVAGCQIQDGWEAIGSLQNLSVLNISGCGLKSLPEPLKNLSNLKAIVAMNNEWTQLAPDVISGWEELNSLIVSHSPSLSSLPSTLASLPHLSKFTFSHCPRLTASSLPDLSALPLLRDVKMNNLPQLTSLPPHIVSWGKGDLSQIKRAKEGDEDANADAIGGGSFSKRGDGLEVLDLGNCSLTFASVSTLFGLSTNAVSAKTSSKKNAATITFPHLRSLSLHSNPLATTHPNYVDLLQQSPDLPNLQIIDAKRVVERKRKGEISESKSDKKARERKEGKMKPSGANGGSSGKMRSWGVERKDGADEREESAAGASGNEGVREDVEVTDTARPNRDQERSEKQDKKERREKDRSKGKRKTRDEEDEGKVVNALKKRRHEASQDRPRHKHASPPVPASVAQKTPAQTTSESIDRIRSKAKPVELPVVAPQNDQERQKNAHAQATAVVGVVEVKNGEEVELTSKKKKKLKSKLNKGAQVSGGVDLKELFGKKHKAAGEDETDVSTADNGIGPGSGWGDADEGGSGLGLGVGGW